MYTYKRVALIGVDGAGNFFKQASTPNLDRIFKDGSIAYDVYTSIPSISAECWGAMLHGVTPDLHRLTNGICSSVPYDPASPFLLGNYMDGDNIHEAPQKSWIDYQERIHGL